MMHMLLLLLSWLASVFWWHFRGNIFKGDLKFNYVALQNNNFRNVMRKKYKESKQKIINETQNLLNPDFFLLNPLFLSLKRKTGHPIP